MAKKMRGFNGYIFILTSFGKWEPLMGPMRHQLWTWMTILISSTTFFTKSIGDKLVFFFLKLKMITVSVFKEGQQHAFKLKIVPLMWLSNLLFEVNVQENPVKIMIWAMLSKLSEIYHFLRFTNGNSVKVPCSGRGDYENLVFHPSTKPEISKT